MGLGKTVQTLAHLMIEKAAGRLNLPSLIVCPTSVIPNWTAEAQRFAPQLSVLPLHGGAVQHDVALALGQRPVRDIEPNSLLARGVH